MAWITYWKSVEKLQAYAQSETHRKGMQWFSKNKRPFLGIIHETYVVPAGNWETIYLNCTPFGLGRQIPVTRHEVNANRAKVKRSKWLKQSLERKGLLLGAHMPMD